MATSAQPQTLDSLDAMQARLRRCRPDDQISGGPILGLIQGARSSPDPKVAALVLSALPERDRYQPSFRYPVADLLRGALAWGQHEVAAGRPFDGAVHVDPIALSQGFLTSPLGKTVVSLSHADPHRFLAQSNGALHATTTFGTHRYTRLGEKRAKLDADGDLLGPAWLAQLIIGAIHGICDVSAQVKLASTNEARDVFALEVFWD